jgi:NADH-quinone oxidoreductase subunit N
MNYAELFRLALPETFVALAALVVLSLDLLALRNEQDPYRKWVLAAFTCFGCLAAIGCLVALPGHGVSGDGMMVTDALTQLVKICLLVLVIFTVLISLQSNFTAHVGEYCALVLMATVGMMLLVSAQNVLMIFTALELTSLSLYVLAGFDKRKLESAEAALKYFLFGGMSAAFTLFGLSLLYGLTGELNLATMALKLRTQTGDPLFLVGLIMTLVGFGFKIAVVPFHLWAPDAYQGAPTASASFIATGSKLASFVVLARVVMVGFQGAEGSAAWQQFGSGWMPLLAIFAAFSIVIGNLAAITQKSVKRLLAYSAIAHAGYALLAILTNNRDGIGSLLYYVVTYALTVLGAFGVVAAVESSRGDSLSDFAGLSRKSPVLSLCMLVFMLSLAGIPPLAGFFGKFYVFTAVLNDPAGRLGLLWLVVLGIAASAVSLYYYLQVLKQIYVIEPREGVPAVEVAAPVQVAIVLLALAVVILGCAPNLLLGRIMAALVPGGFPF